MILLKDYACNNWVNVVLPGGFVLGGYISHDAMCEFFSVSGQICVDLSPIYPAISIGRSADDMHCNAESFPDILR